MRENYQFAAALNRGRNEVRQAAENRLLRLAGDAVETVERAVQDGDSKVALAVLRGVGLLPGLAGAIAADDPKLLKEESEINRARSEHDRRMRRLLAG